MTCDSNEVFTEKKAAESGQVWGAGGALDGRAVGASLGKRPLNEGCFHRPFGRVPASPQPHSPTLLGSGPVSWATAASGFHAHQRLLVGSLIPAEAEARPVK